MEIYVCSAPEGGCGHVGKDEEWTQEGSNNLSCPVCEKDFALQVSSVTCKYMVSNENMEKAKKLLAAHE